MDAAPRHHLMLPPLTSSSLLPSISRATSDSAARPYFSHARTKAWKSRRVQEEKPSVSRRSRSAHGGGWERRGEGVNQGGGEGV